MSYFRAHLPLIAQLTGEHVRLVVCGLTIALLAAIPLGVAAARKPALETPVLALAGAVYTIPSLALLALAVQYAGLGFWSVVAVLAAYAQFVLIRAVAIALRSVPQRHAEAAAGLGMTSAQRFLRVEVPLAMPVFLGGVRVAAVASIAIATLGGYVGAGGLGTEIFYGLSRQYPEQTLAGSIPAALLAIAADALFRLWERAIRARVSE